MNVNDRVALIPGANRPIGKAIAELFGSKGAKLVLPVYDWPESTELMIEEFSTRKFSFQHIAADLRHPQDCRKVANFIQEKYGRLDYLINNIERGGMPVVHGSYDLPHNARQWELEFDTTVKAKYLLYKHCFPLIRKRPGAAVVNISSIAAEIGRSGPAAVFFSDGYSGANRAIHSLTHTWARELAPEVRVNELQLGLVSGRHGENTRGWATLSKKQKKDLLKHTLLARTGRPEEVAEAVLFLAVSGSFITGSCLRIDGGFTLGGASVPPLPAGIL